MAKMGRPRSQNPLDQPVTARFDAATMRALDEFRGAWSRALAVRVLVERALFGDGRLGTEFDPKPAMGGGVIVTRVIAGTAADREGIRVGDTIMSIDGKPIRDVGALVSSLQGLFAGDVVTVELRRRGRLVRLAVVLGRRPFD